MKPKLWTTKITARLARAAIQLVAFAGAGLAAWVLSDDALGLIPDTAPWLVGFAVTAQPILSQLIGNYAGKVQHWLETQDDRP